MEANRRGEFGDKNVKMEFCKDQVRCRPKPWGNEHAVCDFIDNNFSSGGYQNTLNWEAKRRRKGSGFLKEKAQKGLAKSWDVFFQGGVSLSL